MNEGRDGVPEGWETSTDFQTQSQCPAILCHGGVQDYFKLLTIYIGQIIKPMAHVKGTTRFQGCMLISFQTTNSTLYCTPNIRPENLS